MEKKRVLICELHQESDTFNPIVMDLPEFEHTRYAEGADFFARIAPLKCAAQGIDAYITGDCGHHDFDAARRLGIALIDAGHYDTEKCIPDILADVLRQSKYGAELDVRVSTRMENPMRVYGA